MKAECCVELEECLADEICTCSLDCVEGGKDPAHCVVQCGGDWGTSRLAHLVACTWQNECGCAHWGDAGNVGLGD
jgi:hypothetical protein